MCTECHNDKTKINWYGLKMVGEYIYAFKDKKVYRKSEKDEHFVEVEFKNETDLNKLIEELKKK